MRTLPFALVIGALAPVAVQLAQRFGATVVVAVGLVLMSAGFGLASTADAHSAYWGKIVISMVLMAAGLGLISGPATESIMGALPRTRPVPVRRSTTPRASWAEPWAWPSSARSWPRSTAPS